ncbi:unnamed protein product [Eruca vesicaria subsp. sativa]|uniref:BAHD acyltransferase n=1 Tax=Eruca vesicaria subsp. sativa TaxID=29727 RepID=A0ABC8JCR5_ERUVS|nr:unnamed protein product [Eruca vesicaria subsp. sativa]
MKVKLEVTGREVIKPSSPSPHERLQLSLLDLSCPAIYVATTFFYKSITGEKESPENISQRLKTSLSETLSRFYPLAGRQEGVSIRCNDEGVIFTEARTNLLLSDFLRNLSTDSLAAFLPENEEGESAGTWPLLRVKVSFFGSGSGVAVTVGISHQICDASSLLTFVQSWAGTTKGTTTTCTPHFAGATIYPPPDKSFKSPCIDDLYELQGKCVTNRLVFKASKIAELKRKAVSESVVLPSRVEAIMSLIWRCAVKAARSNSVSPKSTVMTQAMDLRLRIPSNVLPQDSMGNLQTCFFLKRGVESELEIKQLVVDFRKAKEEINHMIKENLQGCDNDTANITTTTLSQNLLSVMGSFMSECFKPDIDLYTMSSWCKKPFYEVDFGWGNPVWMGPASHTIYDNVVFVVLMDSKDGQDVEAWVGLPEQDMPVFLCEQDLLAYAVLNPPVLI